MKKPRFRKYVFFGGGKPEESVVSSCLGSFLGKPEAKDEKHTF